MTEKRIGWMMLNNFCCASTQAIIVHTVGTGILALVLLLVPYVSDTVAFSVAHFA